MPNTSREQSIRIVTVFFATLVGFGLKRILDDSIAAPPNGLTPYAWKCFMLAMFLFLRFLLGSANHLWIVHIRQTTHPSTVPRKGLDNVESPTLRWLFENYNCLVEHRDIVGLTIDFAFLVLFGMIALYICYSPNLDIFLARNLLLPIGALLWSKANLLLIQMNLRTGADTDFGFFITADLLQLVAVLITLVLTAPGGFTVDWVLFGLLLFYATLLLYDLVGQLRELNKLDRPQSASVKI